MFRASGGKLGRRLAALVTALSVTAVIASCAPLPPPPVTVRYPAVEYRVLGGIEQIYVIGANPGDKITISAPGEKPQSGVADKLGSLAIRDLTQGVTYSVANQTSKVTKQVRVLVATENPPRAFYEQTKMKEGLNYITMRDGITLAATVRPPLGQSLSDGPFPTVIEYSGYQVAAPHEPLEAKIRALLKLPQDPLAPADSTDVGGLLVRLAGFAVVSIQLRGSGCSGGESDLFDLPTRYDGYDAVETVAAQKWVSNGTVGMVGISFSGFSQLAVASTHPPHLSAITPLSFVGSLYDLAHPGGIYNDGFANSWLAQRQENARPAPDPLALPYANYMVQTDSNCAYNQRLRLQTRDGVEMVRDNDLNNEIYTRRDFRTMMKQIEVPTFASLQFNDEETGAYAILSSQDLLDANSRVWLNVSNGHHRDAVTPDTITDLMEFLDIYVAKRPPQWKMLISILAPAIFGDGTIAPPLPSIFTSTVKDAAKQFEAKPRVRVLLGLRKGMNEHTNTGARWKFDASSFPIAGSTDQTWYLGENGSLSADPGSASEVQYRSDPGARPKTSAPADQDPNEMTTNIVWSEVPEGNGVGFVSAPLTEGVVALGPAAAQIRLSSSAADTDLGITISEVRPDGQEMLVSTGVQRASLRTVDAARSTSTRPAFSDLLKLPALGGSTVTVPVQILPLGHVFRAGSRIRIGIQAVGGDAERWSYSSVDPNGGSTVNTIHLGGAQPSSVTLTVAPQKGYPATLEACPSVGSPCRTWIPAVNGG